MRASISRTFGGGAAKLESENTMTLEIDYGFSVSKNRIEFSFPLVINGKSFNYSFKLELDPGDLYFDKPKMVETVISRAQEILQDNLALAIRESMVGLAETSLYGAGIHIKSTKAMMTKRLMKSAGKEVSRQLRQKTGKEKVGESEYASLLRDERSLSDSYKIVKRDYTKQYSEYRARNKRFGSNLLGWTKEWTKYANKEYGHLPFAYLFADDYTVTEVAHKQLALERNVSTSALDRFILPKARAAERFPSRRLAERM